MKSHKKRQTTNPKFKKLDREHVRSLGVAKLPSLDYSWRERNSDSGSEMKPYNPPKQIQNIPYYLRKI